MLPVCTLSNNGLFPSATGDSNLDQYLNMLIYCNRCKFYHFSNGTNNQLCVECLEAAQSINIRPQVLTTQDLSRSAPGGMARRLDQLCTKLENLEIRENTRMVCMFPLLHIDL